MSWSAWPDYKGIETPLLYKYIILLYNLKCLTRLQGDWNLNNVLHQSTAIELEVPDPITRGLKLKVSSAVSWLCSSWSAWPDYKGIETLYQKPYQDHHLHLEVPDPITRGLKLIEASQSPNSVPAWSAWPDYKGIETRNTARQYLFQLHLKCLTRLQGDWNFSTSFIWIACSGLKCLTRLQGDWNPFITSLHNPFKVLKCLTRLQGDWNLG